MKLKSILLAAAVVALSTPAMANQEKVGDVVTSATGVGQIAGVAVSGVRLSEGAMLFAAPLAAGSGIAKGIMSACHKRYKEHLANGGEPLEFNPAGIRLSQMPRAQRKFKNPSCRGEDLKHVVSNFHEEVGSTGKPITKEYYELAMNP